MNKTKKSISIIMEILLICSIILAVLSIFLRYTALNKDTYITILNKNNTYDQVKESIYGKIDAVLSAKNINYDIKESIITEDDIREEADTMISGLIDYLKTGENNIKPLNTELYKQRVSDILQSVFGNLKADKNSVSYNDNYSVENIAYEGYNFISNNMVVKKEQSQVAGKGSLNVEKLMSKEEAEAKVREILKQKGLTEEQAIEKARKKGITEEQALNILAGYGITIDDDSEENGAASESDSNNSNDSSSASDNNSIQNPEGESHDDKTRSADNKTPVTKSAKNQLSNIEKKLQNEAETNIDKEVEKFNVDKILESSKIGVIAKVTSEVYKLFWVFMTLPIILMVTLIKINGKADDSSFRYIRNAFLLSGLILVAVPLAAYTLKISERINIGQAYLINTISYTINYFLQILIMYGSIVFVLGLFMFLPKVVKR